MTSHRKMNRRAEMEGYYKAREFYIAGSKIVNTSKRFPHVKYTKQLIKDNKHE